MVADVALEVVLGGLDLAQELLVLRLRVCQVALLGLERRLRLLELSLFVGDRVARSADPVHRLLLLVTKALHADGDRGVLGLDPLKVVVAREHVPEPVRVEDHRHRIRAVRLVDPDEPLAQNAERPLELRAELLEADLRLLELRLLLVQLRLGDRDLVAERRDLVAQLVQLVAVLLDRRGEHALAVLGVLELRLLLVELRPRVVEVLLDLLEGLRRRTAGHGECGEHDQRTREREHDGSASGSRSVVPRSHVSL